METFTLDPRCWRITRVFGRNPLLRRTDRVEALIMVVALAVSLIAVPVAGVVGAVTYGHAVGPPAPNGLTAAEAGAVAVVTALAVPVAMWALVAVARARLDRARDALWERDIEFLAETS